MKKNKEVLISYEVSIGSNNFALHFQPLKDENIVGGFFIVLDDISNRARNKIGHPFATGSLSIESLKHLIYRLNKIKEDFENDTRTESK